jgi:inner membrane protein
MNPALPPPLPSETKRRQFLFLKIVGICLLIVLLHVPLALTRGVLVERRNYQAQATEQIASVWGREQGIVGPVLAVPYAYESQVMRSRVVNGKAVQVEEMVLVPGTAYFLPETLAVNGRVDPEVRRRGIYETVVYSSRLKMDAAFQPDFALAGIEAKRVDWDKARMLIGVSDLHGVRSITVPEAANRTGATFESTDRMPDAFLPLGAKVSGVVSGDRFQFAVEIALQGSERLEVAPIGKQTSVKLESSWADPSFTGASLPVGREVSAEGFKAEWQSSHFSRGFPQSWTANQFTRDEMSAKIAGARFGVKFAQLVDGYSMVERAQKYGVLFFVLTFAVFFLFETTAALRIHPLQYLLVGAALCLFFIAFLALSEFWPTGRAYGIAALACTGMIALYAWTFLKTGWRTLVIAGGLAATYGYLYFVLQSQDYALIAGTSALFAALALVMFCTRKLNWYTLELSPTNAMATSSSGNTQL